jgi:signal transduction histidine kinase
MIERHGGRLELESAPGLGTTAMLIFPLSRIVRNTVVTEAPAGLRSMRR